jgi:hypothetical protein
MAAASPNTDNRLHAAADYGHGGTGDRFARAVIIVAGVCSLVASLITFVCVVPVCFPRLIAQY